MDCQPKFSLSRSKDPRLCRDRWQRFRCEPRFWYFVVSVLAVTAAIIVLRKMEHPWEGLTGKRIREGRSWLGEDYGRYWGFWIGLGVTVLVAVIALLSRWWWSWAHPPVAASPAIETARFRRISWLMLGTIVLFAAWIRVPHLNGPILRDEQDTLRYHIHGYHFYDPKNDGVFTFKQVTWADAAFWNPGGNNPVLLSVASKASLSLWHRLSGAPEDRFSRIAVRLPVLIAGLLSLVTLAWCVFGFAPQRVALLAALIAAIHPLHAEYCVQARGYAFVMLGAGLALGGAIRALRGGAWRHWIALVGGCAVMLYAYLGSLFFVGPLSLTVIGVVAARWRQAARAGGDGEEALAAARRDAIRLVVTGLVGVGVYLVLALPSVVCFWEHRERFPWKFTPQANWWFVLWTEYASGRLLQLPRSPEGAVAPLAEVVHVIIKPQPLLWFGTVVATSLTLAGMVRVWRKSERPAACVVGVAFLAPFFQIAAHGLLTHMVLFFFHLIYWLPVVIALEAWGADGFIAWIADRVAAVPGTDNATGAPAPAATPRWRVAWIVFAFAFVAFILRSARPGRLPLRWMMGQQASEPEIFDRGKFHWIVYPEGRTLKLDLDRPVPATFPAEPIITTTR